jgi:hypothetical protein
LNCTLQVSPSPFVSISSSTRVNWGMVPISTRLNSDSIRLDKYCSPTVVRRSRSAPLG